MFDMEKMVSSRVIHQGKNFSFKTDETELDNGVIVNRDIVDHPGAVAIIPLLGDGQIVFVRQFRYAAGRELLELPAGTLEKGENPDQCAARELKEETGYTAGSIKKILACYMAPGYSNEVIHFYLASDLKEGKQATEQDESIRVQVFGFDEALKMIEDGGLMDAKTVAGVLTFLTR